MEKIIVSACLCGIPCRMDGKAKPVEAIVELYKKGIAIPVCPEVEGGLPTPRVPSERRGECVVSREGKDVTEEFKLGAERCLQKAKDLGITRAILKSKSPSCGVGVIHNGKFDGGLVPGDGVFAELCMKNGISCQTEKDF